MKKILKFLMAVSFGAIIGACNGEQLDIDGEMMPDPGPEVVPEATLTLSQSEITMGGSLYNEGETTLQTNQTVFDAKSSATWAEPVFEGKILKVRAAEANDTGAERTATVTVTAGEGENTATATLTVKQLLRDAASEDAVLELEKTTADFTYENGQTETIIFTTNKQDELFVTIEAGGEEWLSAVIAEDGQSVILTTISENATNMVKKTVVTITAGTGDKAATATINVSQSVNVPTGIQIGALYENGDTKGMIAIIADDQSWIKIISLEESKEAWSTENMATGLLSNNDDGAGNTEIIKALPNYESSYPAAKYCVDLGDGWYWPSRGEWNAVADNTRNQQEVINTYLSAYGGTALDFGSYYWVSNENTAEQGNAIRLKDKGFYKGNKATVRNVRAMKQIMLNN